MLSSSGTSVSGCFVYAVAAVLIFSLQTERFSANNTNSAEECESSVLSNDSSKYFSSFCRLMALTTRNHEKPIKNRHSIQTKRKSKVLFRKNPLLILIACDIYCVCGNTESIFRHFTQNFISFNLRIKMLKPNQSTTSYNFVSVFRSFPLSLSLEKYFSIVHGER